MAWHRAFTMSSVCPSDVPYRTSTRVMAAAFPTQGMSARV
jgi:hypothetical protein